MPAQRDVYRLSVSDLWHGCRLVAVPFWDKAASQLSIARTKSRLYFTPSQRIKRQAIRDLLGFSDSHLGDPARLCRAGRGGAWVHESLGSLSGVVVERGVWVWIL